MLVIGDYLILELHLFVRHFLAPEKVKILINTSNLKLIVQKLGHLTNCLFILNDSCTLDEPGL